VPAIAVELGIDIGLGPALVAKLCFATSARVPLRERFTQDRLSLHLT
jgi:hypothetical protein